MATTIKLKNGSGAPTTGDLVQGEPAFDLTNKRLYTEDSGGSVIEVGTNPTSLTTGGLTTDGTVLLQGDSMTLKRTSASAENYIVCTPNSSVDLFWNGASRLTTTSTGIDVTGDVNSDSLTTGTFTSTGIDDNATSTAITIDSSQNVTFASKATVGYSRAAGTGGIVLYDDDQAENRLTLLTGGGTGINAVINQAGGSLNITDASLNAVATFNDGGNVGIGTASPAFSAGGGLQVQASTFSSVRVTETGNTGLDISQSSDAKGYVYLRDNADLIFGTNNTERMRISSAGNLLVGNTAPIGTEKLNVSIASGGSAYSTSSMQSSALAWLNNAENDLTKASTLVLRQFNAASAISGLYTGTQNAALTFGTSSSGSSGNVVERLRIDSSGNVIIKPSGKLYLESSSGFSPYLVEASNALTVNTNAAERMRIDSSGNVGIGTTSPNSLLDVKSQGVNNEVIRVTNSYDNQHFIIKQDGSGGFSLKSSVDLDFHADYDNNTADAASRLRFFTDASERMRIDASGNLLVGTTASPSAGSAGVQLYNNSSRGRVDIGKTATGTANALANYHNGTYVGGVNYSDTATSFPTSSDVRLKENIVDAPAGNIDAIRVRSFDWKADGSHQTYGMIAQELVEAAPEAVAQGETEEDMWGVDYSKLVPMMIKEIQDLKAEVAALKGA